MLGQLDATSELQQTRALSARGASLNAVLSQQRLKIINGGCSSISTWQPGAGFSGKANVAKKQLKRNDWVVYRKQKTSKTPGPRASDVRPAGKGDSYNYMVDKYWVVEEVLDSGEVKLCTRRGKRNVVPADDPQLRSASWWERLVYRSRFNSIDLSEADADG